MEGLGFRVTVRVEGSMLGVKGLFRVKALGLRV